MTETRLSDAQWVAGQAALAFQDGRIALGEAFGRLALRCHVAELHQAATSLRISDSAPMFDQAVEDNGFFGPATIEAAEPAGPIEVPETARCMYSIVENNLRTECHAGIYKKSDADAWWWTHVDPKLDTHQALGPIPS